MSKYFEMFEIIFLHDDFTKEKFHLISVFLFPKIIFLEHFSSVRIYAKVYNNNHILLWGLNEMIILYFLEAWVCYIERQVCTPSTFNLILIAATRKPKHTWFWCCSTFFVIPFNLLSKKRKANCKHFQRCIFYVWMMAWIGRNEIEKYFFGKFSNLCIRKKILSQTSWDLPKIYLKSVTLC